MAQRARTSVACLLRPASVLVVTLAAGACAAPAVPAAPADMSAARSDLAPSSVTPATESSAAPASGADAVVLFPGRLTNDMTVLDVVAEVAEEAGVEFVMDDACRRRLASAKVILCFTHAVRRAELCEWLESVLRIGGVALVSTAGSPPDGRPQWICVDRTGK